MRRLSLLLILAILSIGIFRTQAQQVIVSDDTTYTSPASGSVLDVKSTSKGFMPPRVALTGRTDATTISSPSTGLLVFNTANAGSSPDTIYEGYYYNSGTSGSPNWTRAMNMNVTNGMSFQNDGSPILNGTATAWDDMVVNPALARNSGATVPSWLVFVTPDIFAYIFDHAKTQSLDFSVQLPHGYKLGTTLYPHIHWSPTTAPGTTRVMWQLDYQWVNLNGLFVYSGGTTTITGSEVVGGATVSLSAYQHTITPIGSGIVGTGNGISSVLMCRITRLGSDPGDTFTGSAAMLSLDFHYEIDTFGSRTAFTK